MRNVLIACLGLATVGYTLPAIGQANAPPADAAPGVQAATGEGPTGTATGFDTRMAPGAQWHEVIRNDGIEMLRVAGQTRAALKIMHYREGFEGNTYRSVVTGWKDMETGMMIYVTYRHISGAPQPGPPGCRVAPCTRSKSPARNATC